MDFEPRSTVRYRLMAEEIRAVARTVTCEDARLSLLHLADAYERMASTKDAEQMARPRLARA